MYALGKHLLVELRDCSRIKMESINFIRTTMLAAAEEAGATVVSDSFHEFNPFGISGVVVIAESHLTIHTWPEYAYAAVDIFTCGDNMKPELAAKHLIREFESLSPSIVEMMRGILGDGQTKLPHKNAEICAESPT